MTDRDTRITNALSPLFWWAKEPVMTATVFTSAVLATINYLELTGQYTLDDELLLLIIAWLNVIGLMVRSQYTPYANRTNDA